MSPGPDVGQVTGPAARDEVNGVDADHVAETGVARREAFGGDRDPAQAVGVERPCGGILGLALLDLDEGEGAAAARDEVDFAAGNARSLGEDRPAVKPQPPGGDAFGAPSALLGGITVQVALRSRARA